MDIGRMSNGPMVWLSKNDDGTINNQLYINEACPSLVSSDPPSPRDGCYYLVALFVSANGGPWKAPVTKQRKEPNGANESVVLGERDGITPISTLCAKNATSQLVRRQFWSASDFFLARRLVRVNKRPG
jgi:hypothetical protein